MPVPRHRLRIACAVLFAALGLSRAMAAPADAARLVGTWRLVSATERMTDGTERPDPNVGARGRGYIIYTATGQVCALLANSERAPWAVADRPSAAEASAIPANMVAYCGAYSVDEAGASWSITSRSIFPRTAPEPTAGASSRSPATASSSPPRLRCRTVCAL
ncbi:MAG: lipocalin-like domain-containing protein [Caulobacteraceae bacterium]|nr:lipocalin-like domain-containing protein [Caulobacteraceae bacterium]